MKLFLTCLLFLTSFSSLKAQEENVLPLDENGKFIFYKVVTTTDPKEILKERAIEYLKKHNKDLRFKGTEGDSAITATGKFVIDKTLLVMSHPSGEVLFNFKAELKDGKYRFWLTDFKFIPYQRDRYSNFIASTTISVPLENDPGKLNASQWKEYQVQTAKYAKTLGDKFTNYLSKQKPVAVQAPEKKIVTKNW